MAKENDDQVTPDHELVLVDDRGDYSILTMNRPEKRNAMNQALRTRLREAMAESYDKKVVVLTGVGKSFCAGQDIVAGRAAPRPKKERLTKSDWEVTQQTLRAHPAIFIAAVNGYALGGGTTMVNNCELAIAAESASFGAPHISFGIWPDITAPTIIRRVHPKHAAEMIFAAERISSATAYRMGMVNEVVPDDQLLPRAIELAERIAAFDPVVLDRGKKAYHKLMELGWEDGLDYSNLVAKNVKSDRTDPNDGVDAFVSGKRGSGQGKIDPV